MPYYFLSNSPLNTDGSDIDGEAGAADAFFSVVKNDYLTKEAPQNTLFFVNLHFLEITQASGPLMIVDRTTSILPKHLDFHSLDATAETTGASLRVIDEVSDALQSLSALSLMRHVSPRDTVGSYLLNIHINEAFLKNGHLVSLIQLLAKSCNITMAPH